MSNLLFTFLTIICLLCHLPLGIQIRRGQIRESFCIGWCIDLLFSICGTALSFYLYEYDLRPHLNGTHVLVLLLYLLVILLMLLLAPTGWRLLRPGTVAKESLLGAEYRFDHTLRMVCRCLTILLLTLPPILRLLSADGYCQALSIPFSDTRLWSGFCFICFLILLPVSLRQCIFWLRQLQQEPDTREQQLLECYRAHLHYRKRNYRL